MNARNARLLTRGLALACAGLAGLAVVQYAGLGRGYRWAPDGASGEPAPFGKIDEQTVELPPMAAFAQIEAHPLFNPDRQPTEVGQGDALAGDADEDAAPVNPLAVALTGVILDEADGVRIAMLQDQARNQPVALRVGMPLEGEQSAWTLVEVHPRKVVFRNPSDETAEIELETAAPQPARQPPPARGRPAPQPPPRSGAAQPGRAPATADPSAVQPPPGAQEDLARRIEERRRQMREEALKDEAAEQEKNGAGKRGPNQTVTE